MPETKRDIIARLQREILPLQGFKPAKAGMLDNLGPINAAFPGNAFPIGAIHEFISDKKEGLSASAGFIAHILSALMKTGSVCIWIGTRRAVYPPALKLYGIAPEKVIFIDLPSEKQVCWTMEEALKCEGLAAVVAECKDVDFTTSRRLQLAVENSRVTGFLLRNSPRYATASASVARWRITSLPSELLNGMPGVGHARWNVELLKIRNGKPGTWQVEWGAGRFRSIIPNSLFAVPAERKVI